MEKAPSTNEILKLPLPALTGGTVTVTSQTLHILHLLIAHNIIAPYTFL